MSGMQTLRGDYIRGKKKMLIHGFVNDSRVNGPGLRAVVYFQGCTLGCRDCWNPESHTFAGEERSIAEVTNLVVSRIKSAPLKGSRFRAENRCSKPAHCGS
jgi:pyruvate-formate lyase-activating enzyme